MERTPNALARAAYRCSSAIRGWRHSASVRRLAGASLLVPLLAATSFGIGGVVATSTKPVTTANSPSKCSGAGNKPTSSPASTSTIPYFCHVFVFMFENHSYQDIAYEHDLPFISYLERHYDVATHEYGVVNPTEGNRIAILSGHGSHVFHDNISTGELTYPNLVDQLTRHGLSWDGYYQRQVPSTEAHPTYGFQSGSTTFQDFKDIEDSPSRLSHLEPLRDLATALKDNTVPRFSWVHATFSGDTSTGNMNGGFRLQGAGTGATRKDHEIERGGDAFLHKWVTAIMSSAAWRSGPSAIFFTFDETNFDGSAPQNGLFLSSSGTTGSATVPAGFMPEYSSSEVPGATFPFPGGVFGGGRIPTIVITNPPRHVVSSTPYNEYSILKTIEAGWHLSYLGHAGQSGVHTMSAFFGGKSAPPAPPVPSSRNLPASSSTFKATATTSKIRSWDGGSSSAKGILAPNRDPYLTEATDNQAAAVLTVTPASGTLAYPHRIRLELPSASAVTFAAGSNPVAATSRDPNPGFHAFTPRYGPTTVTPHEVIVPTGPLSGPVPGSAIISRLLVNVPAGTPVGPVKVTVVSGGVDLGQAVIGTVGKPEPTALNPRLLAPVVNKGSVTIRFVPPKGARPGSSYRVQIEGVHPTTTSVTCTQCQDGNEYFSGYTRGNVVTVTNSEAQLTSLAGKEYWVRVADMSAPHHGPDKTQWSSTTTFSVLR